MQKKPVKKAVIPAAGLGTRFLPATKAIPKEMLPIVDIPTVQYIVEEAVQSGIEEILIITNSNKHCMENHFDKNYELEARLLESGKQEEADLIKSGGSPVNYYSQLLGKPALLVETLKNSSFYPMAQENRERTYQEIRTMPLEIINKT